MKPDRIRLRISDEKTEATYDQAIRTSAEMKAYFNDALEDLGFCRADLKTLHFSVDTDYERYQDEEMCWRSRFLGYKYTHRMKLEFPVDNQMLGRILAQLVTVPSCPEFTIEYTISDPETANNSSK